MELETLQFARKVLQEDLGRGDLFERVAPARPGAAKIRAKSAGIFAGAPYAQAIAKLLDLELLWQIRDGEPFEAGETLARLYGSSIALLQGERAILNTILHASSIATKAHQFVQASQGKIMVLDTRKSRPLLRVFEKYAARVGGVTNHRMGLDDCLMLKDTHLALIDEDLATFISKARRKIPFTAKIEVECESFELAQRAMAAGADIIMCDNMELQEIERVVQLRNEAYPHILIEASGNITTDTIRSYVAIGVDAVSSGSIFHQATWPDISMRIES